MYTLSLGGTSFPCPFAQAIALLEFPPSHSCFWRNSVHFSRLCSRPLEYLRAPPLLPLGMGLSLPRLPAAATEALAFSILSLRTLAGLEQCLPRCLTSNQSYFFKNVCKRQCHVLRTGKGPVCFPFSFQPLLLGEIVSPSPIPLCRVVASPYAFLTLRQPRELFSRRILECPAS